MDRFDRLEADLHIKNLLAALAYGQDNVDGDLLTRLFARGQPIRFDATRHLPGHPVAELGSGAEAAAMICGSLSGFTGTQHAQSNVIVKLDHRDPRTRARAVAAVCAYHYIDPSEEAGGDAAGGGKGPSFVTARGNLGVDVICQPGDAADGGDNHEYDSEATRRGLDGWGDWRVAGITIWRNLPLEGAPELYAKAHERATRGLGRPSGSAGMTPPP